MPSPFPGMDPYLESPPDWPGFHNMFADQISRALNRDLPPPYYAQIERRAEVGSENVAIDRGIIPDVLVRGGPTAHLAAGSATAVASPSVSDCWECVLAEEFAELAYVEIHDTRADHEVVTLIELLSPSNKQSGPDRRDFLQKRASILASRVSLVEIDLLRSGRPLWTPHGLDQPGWRQPDYLIAVNRGWERGVDFRLRVFPAFLRESLPVIAVPLREYEEELPLDLQCCFGTVYDAGPYRRGLIDYTRPPAVPLPEDHRAWAAERIAAWRTPA